MCILLFSVLSNSVTAWQSLQVMFYKIAVTGPVISVNIVRVSTIFLKKLLCPNISHSYYFSSNICIPAVRIVL